ncbi:MAG TPA: pyridoxamine 5'-phosphate oxidase [Gemmatimonadaceae bacterium]|nr:pyridoxamine 5'-phosphate oxidase [Gemmatimonadaceae bacterium]
MADLRDAQDPVALFQRLLADAQSEPRERVPEPTAFALATATPDGRPSVRMLLLKHADHDGFVFYTNMESRKAKELARNPRAAMNFHWTALERQVRVEGEVKPVTAAEADAYFASRPRGSQIGAWASKQSRPIASEGELEARVDEFERKFEGKEVARPPHWSGFRLVPETIEFWYGKPSRLHVRHLYTRQGSDWRVETLYP